MRHRLRFAAALAVISAACSPDAVGDRQELEVDHADARKAAESNVLWHIADEPEVVIGLGDDPAHQLASVRAAFVLTSGAIVVVDNDQKEIRYFSPAGEHLSSVGREGEGPGEYRSLWSAVRLPGDTLLIADPWLKRLTLLDPSGAYVRSFQPEPPPWFRMDLVDAIDARTVLVISGGTSSELYSDGLRRDTVSLDLLDITSGHLRSLGHYPAMEGIRKTKADGVINGRLAPFSRAFHAAAGDSRFYAGISDGDSIGIFNHKGDRVGELQEVRPTRTVTPAMVRKELSRIPTRRTRYYPDAAPPTLPVFDELAVDPDGWVWVRRYNLPWEDTVAIMDVHDPSGKWQGTVRLPASRIRPYILDIGRDYVLLLMIGDLGIPYIVKYRLLKE